MQYRWFSRATEARCEMFMPNPPVEAHLLRGANLLTDHLPDRTPAGRFLDWVVSTLPKSPLFVAEDPVPGYSLTAPQFAPDASSS